MGLAAVHEKIGIIQGGLEETLIRLEFQGVRHNAICVGDHPVGRDDCIALDTKCGHQPRISGLALDLRPAPITRWIARFNSWFRRLD
jgi:hypothetical protein